MSRVPLLLALLGYAVLATLVQVHCADLLSSDGECYLRIAAYCAKGEFRRALFGHWSPLGPWLTVPLVAAGMVPRVAFRVMIFLWGAAAVIGTWRLAGRFGLRGVGRAAAAACAALLAAEFSADHRVDLLLTALLLFYLDAAMDERLLGSPRWALGVGALGGVGYLAKLYALPFFAVHFPLMVLARAWASRGAGARAISDCRFPIAESRPGKGVAPGLPAHEIANRKSQIANPCGTLLGLALRAWLLGVTGFALVAAPWVAVLSAKYGRLTFGTAAAQTYAQFGPGSGQARWWGITGLRTPPAHAYNVWQDADFDLPVDPRPTSPLRSGSAFAEQMRAARRNLGVIVDHLRALDWLHLGLAALGLTPLAFLASLRRREVAFRYLAVVAAVIVFCGGYVFIHAEDERFFWFVFLVAVVIAVHFVALVPRGLGLLGLRAGAIGNRQSAIGNGQRRLVAAAVALVVFSSFAARPAEFFWQLFSAPPPGRQHRLMAKRLAELGVSGPLAAAGRHEGFGSAWHNGLHTAYYLDAQYAGMPAARTPERIVVEMREAGARTLLVWGDPTLAAALRAEGALDLVQILPAGGLTGLGADVVVFRLRDP